MYLRYEEPDTPLRGANFRVRKESQSFPSKFNTHFQSNITPDESEYARKRSHRGL